MAHSGIQTYQILTNNEEVCIASLSSILLAVCALIWTSKTKFKSYQLSWFTTNNCCHTISGEKTKERRKTIANKTNSKDPTVLISDLDEIEALTEYLNESKLAMLTFKRNELSIELVIQLSVHLIMVCLSQTDYPLESGLQGIFQVRQ